MAWITNFTQPVLMGVLNVTPDSFSDGGRFSGSNSGDHDTAVEHAVRLAADGAAVIDVGGEATSFHRSGIGPVDPELQIQRVVPVIAGIRRRSVMDKNFRQPMLLSIDTRSARVAQAALDAGADAINDVSAGTHDPAMFALVARRNCPIVLMHMRSEEPNQPPPVYSDVCTEVFSYLQQRASAAEAAGIDRRNILLDPGIGFGKTAADNWRLLGGIPALVSTGYPVLVGVSRKRFLADLCPGEVHGAAKPDWSARDQATAILTALLAARGVLVHRVHDVRLAAQALSAVQLLQE
jgi:dihydropteroate synthase